MSLLEVVVRALEEADSKAEVRSVVSDLTALGVDGGHICRLIARFGGVRSLLGVCLEPWLRQCRVDALRALATVCCVVEGIAELEKVKNEDNHLLMFVLQSEHTQQRR